MSSPTPNASPAVRRSDEEVTDVSQLFPIIATADVGRALGFYRDLPGGTVGYEFAGADGAPAYAGMEIGRSHLGIGLEPAGTPDGRPRSTSLWVYADD